MARNVTTRVGEIDLIVAVDDEVAATEVRTARRREMGPGLIDYRKESQMRAVALSADPPIFRIDLVAVMVGEDGVRVWWYRRL